MNDSGGEECSGGDEIVVRWWWGFGRVKRAHIDDCALKFPSRSFFFNFVRRGGEQVKDAAASAPSNNVVRFAAGEQNLCVRGWDINFYTVVNSEGYGSAMLVKLFFGCFCNVCFVRSGYGVKSLHG